MKVKVGVVGVGALGRHHARLYKEVDQAEMVGIFDTNQDAAMAYANEMGFKTFAAVDELLKACDAVSLAVPTDLHFELGMHILEQGKHLLVEKPITETCEQAEALINHARKRKLVLQVGHVERFNPVITALSPKIKAPRFIEAHRMAPYPPLRPGALPRGTEVGVVLDLMIHDIDIVLHLVNSPVQSIDAIGIPVLSPTEDIANARIRFENGCVANLTASRVSPEPMRKIRIFEPDRYLSLDYGQKSAELYKKTEKGISREEIPILDHNALLRELEHFVASVCQKCKPMNASGQGVPGEHGLRALELASQIRQSMAE